MRAGDTYVADFLGVSNLMAVDVVERGPGARCHIKIGEAGLMADRGEIDGLGPAHVVIRPERVRIEPYGSTGDNRVPAMVERLVFLGAATQVMLRLGAGVPLQALVQNDGEPTGLAQGSPVHVFLPPDGLRVLGGATRDVPVSPRRIAGQQLSSRPDHGLRGHPAPQHGGHRGLRRGVRPYRRAAMAQVSLMISLRKRVVPAGVSASADRRFMTSI